MFFCCDICVTTGRCLVQRSPTNCGMPNTCDRQASYGEAISLNGVETHQEKKVEFQEKCETDEKIRHVIGSA